MAGALVALALSCGCRRTPEGEEAAADTEAAMMEGRLAARELFASSQRPKTPADTAEFCAKALSLRSRKQYYDSIGRSESGAAFDSAFISTVRAIDRHLASHLTDRQ